MAFRLQSTRARQSGQGARLAALTFALAAAFAAAPPARAQAAQQATAHDFHIAAGQLDQALNAFAKAGGITVSFRPERCV